MSDPIGTVQRNKSGGYTAECDKCVWVSSQSTFDTAERVLRLHADEVHPPMIAIYREGTR